MAKDLKGTKTHQNLKDAFAGESQANRRYTLWSRVAGLEGAASAVAAFDHAAAEETAHALGHLAYMGGVGSTAALATYDGYIADGDLSTFKPIKSFGDAYLRDNVAESVKHAWYKGGKGALHPYKGETIAEVGDFQEGGKYSFVKSPTFQGQPAQVGPLARVLAAVPVASPLLVTVTVQVQVWPTTAA